jgi:hypothetical protein
MVIMFPLLSSFEEVFPLHWCHTDLSFELKLKKKKKDRVGKS